MSGKKTTVGAGALLGLLGGALAHANPQGGVVASGQATFSHPTPGTLNVTNSNGAIVNWQSFSIGAQETTRFIQPSAASAVLNRVVGQDPSAILGQLLSNGRVYLINPNGIVFGAGARVDTAGLIASTLNISDEDFKAGRLKFQGGSDAGAIKNQGYIKAGPGGEVVLIAPRIENSGIVETPDGKLILAAGQSVNIASLDFDDIVFEVHAPENEVVNLGQLIAERGTVGVFAGGIRNAGTISADSASMDAQGRVVLAAASDIHLESTSTITANSPAGGDIRVESKEGTTWVAGDVEATGSEGTGGSIHLLGERVAVLDGATLDASGERGGGEILVGGDYQGKNPDIHNAKQTYVAATATLKADALSEGDGGKVIVWGDETTQAYGQISARGGAEGGDGGFIETSGAWLDVYGIRVDASAPLGKGGEWLLDPNNITIDSAFTGNSNVSATGTSPFLIASTGDSAEVMVSTIANALDAGFNVTIQTSGGGSEAGNINVNALIDPPPSSTGTNDTTLTFNAHNDININAGITWASAVFKLNMVFNADSDNLGGGSVNLGSGITLDANGGTINAAGEIVNITSGLVTINSDFFGGTLNVNTGGNAITGAGDITVDTLKWTHGNILGTTGTELLTTNGTTTLAAAGPPPCFPCPDSSVNLGRNWINNGTVNHTFGRLQLTGIGQFLNNAGATYDLTTDAGNIFLDAGTVFNNAGTLKMNTGTDIKIGVSGGSFNNSGEVIVKSGTLEIVAEDTDGIGPNGDMGSYTVESGAALVFSDHYRDFLGGSSITGAGDVIFESINDDVINIFGVYNVSGQSSASGDFDIFFHNAATLGSLDLALNGGFSLDGAGDITVNNDFTWSGGDITGSGVFTTRGQSTLDAGAGLSFAGKTWNNTGSVAINNGTVLFSSPAFNMNGGAFNISTGATADFDDTPFNWTAGTLAGSGALTLTGGLAVLNITGAGARVLNGLSLTLPTLNLNGGSLDVQSGSLDVSGATTIASGATLALAGGTNNFDGLVTNNGTWKIATPITLGSFTNNGLMLLDGGAVLNPGAPGLFKNAQSGVLGGTGTIASDLLNEGTLSPGHSPGTLNITGNLILGPTSTLNIELGGNQQGLSYDLINVSGTAALDGTLNIGLFGNFLPLLGANFDVINYSSATGSFAQVNSPAIFPFTTSNFGSFFRLTSQGVRFPPGTNPIDAILAMGGDRPPSVPPLTTQVAGIGISGEEAIRIIGFQQCP
ncbi:MAG TPA: filamentous hemagglutinin N-terminal domain-containing protein [Methylococcaceae bacterium]|nr:filamentous hemagglutinin N-terminal domain-containing protein [Methylococcaceae bacterium]